MHIGDLLYTKTPDTTFQLLKQRCSQFVHESKGHPLLKNLPSEYTDFHKVKVRKRKSKDNFTDTFNEAFEDLHHGLRQRAIFANSISSFELSESNDVEPFYIFPIDGYDFMYSKEVARSDNDYQQVFDSIFEQMGDNKGTEVLTDLLRFTYTTSNLYEGIENGSEIIMYGIPYYYVVRAQKYPNYTQLLTKVGFNI